ncbi:MAG TPA: hypothetical protein VHF89_20680 [Solirubrobacteraceae bacterium]|nr:hypothetical protein [Solirubrobacteraceae bacterium]
MADDAGTRTRRRRCTARTLAAALLAALSTAPAAVAAGGLAVVDADTGDRRLVASGDKALWEAPCLTAQGTVIAARSTRRGRRYVEHRPDGRRRVVGRAGPANTIVPAPGCARVAEGRLDMPGRPGATGLVVRTPASLRPIVQLDSYWPVEGPWMAWSNDGTRIADIDDSGRRAAVRITDVTTGRTIARRPIPGDSGAIQEGAFSPDGTQVLFVQHDFHPTRGAVDHELSVFDATTGTFRTLLRAPVGPRDHGIGHAAWSPRGDRIAVLRTDGIHLVDVEGRGLGVVAPGAASGTVAWSPDATRLAFQRTRRLRTPRDPRRWPVRRFAIDLVVAPAEPGARGRAVLRDLDWNPVAVWSPDGRSVASITR